jgi:hypothetical protein
MIEGDSRLPARNYLVAGGCRNEEKVQNDGSVRPNRRKKAFIKPQRTNGSTNLGIWDFEF